MNYDLEPNDPCLDELHHCVVHGWVDDCVCAADSCPKCSELVCTHCQCGCGLWLDNASDYCPVCDRDTEVDIKPYGLECRAAVGG